MLLISPPFPSIIAYIYIYISFFQGVLVILVLSNFDGSDKNLPLSSIQFTLTNLEDDSAIGGFPLSSLGGPLDIGAFASSEVTGIHVAANIEDGDPEQQGVILAASVWQSVLSIDLNPSSSPEQQFTASGLYSA